MIYRFGGYGVRRTLPALFHRLRVARLRLPSAACIEHSDKVTLVERPITNSTTTRAMRRCRCGTARPRRSATVPGCGSRCVGARSRRLNETIRHFTFLVFSRREVGYSGRVCRVRECVWSLVCRFVWGLSTILRYLRPAHGARSRRLCKLAQGEAFCDLTVGCDGIASKRL